MFGASQHMLGVWPGGSPRVLAVADDIGIPPHAAAEALDWKSEAIEFWVNRARKRPPKNALSMSALIGEVKNWKPGKFPPGVASYEYIKVVSDALKTSPLFTYDPNDGTFLPNMPVAAMPRPSHLITPSMASAVTEAGHSPLSSSQEYRHWFSMIHDMTERGEPLTLVALKDGVIERTPPGGYRSQSDDPINTEVFYQSLLKALKNHPELACIQVSGKRAFKWVGSRRDAYEGGVRDAAHAMHRDGLHHHAAHRDGGVHGRPQVGLRCLSRLSTLGKSISDARICRHQLKTHVICTRIPTH
jgi:hypothetical protein